MLLIVTRVLVEVAKSNSYTLPIESLNEKKRILFEFPGRGVRPCVTN